MSQSNPQVEQFIASVGQRVDRHRSFRVALWAMIIGGAAMVAIAMYYVLPRNRGPWFWYL